MLSCDSGNTSVKRSSDNRALLSERKSAPELDLKGSIYGNRMVEKCSLGHAVDPNTKECDEGHRADVQVCLVNHDFNTTTNRCTKCGQFNSSTQPPLQTEGAQADPQEAAQAFMRTMMEGMRGMKSEYMKPPEFFRDKGSFKQYKKDLERWERCTSVPAEQRGDVILMNIPSGHKLKEKLELEVGDKVKDARNGVQIILEALDAMYGTDEVLECYLRFRDLEQKQCSVGQDILEYTHEWETLYARANEKGVTLNQMCKAFKLLDTANLDEIDKKLVLSDLDMKTMKGKETLFDQVKYAMRKYYNAGSLKQSGPGLNSKVLIGNTAEAQIDQLEAVLISRGWKKPKKVNKSDEKSSEGENGYARDGSWKKCYKCRKDCTHDRNKCSCPCSSHLAPTCPQRGGDKRKHDGKGEDTAAQDSKKMPDASLYANTLYAALGLTENSTFLAFDCEVVKVKPPQLETGQIKPEEQSETIDLSHWCLMAQNQKIIGSEEVLISIVDTACPTTVTSTSWMKALISKFPEELKSMIKIMKSEKNFKFGGGEQRSSRGCIKFPCYMDTTLGERKLVFIIAEVVDTDFPLLLGGRSLEKARAILDLGKLTMALPGLLGEEAAPIPLKKETSGHYSVKILAMDGAVNSLEAERIFINEDWSTERAEEVVCLLLNSQQRNEEHNCEACNIFLAGQSSESSQEQSKEGRKELTKREVVRLHHFFGHVPAEKLRKILRRAGRLTKNVEKYLEEVDSCEPCQVSKPKLPRPAVALPRAERFNQVVAVDLKTNTKFKGAGNFILYCVDVFSRFKIGVFIPNKEKTTVAEAIINNWIKIFWPMETLHSDRGSEFLNDELSAVCDHLGVKMTATASRSPQANGINERNHFIVDRSMEKMILADDKLDPAVALSWSIYASNCLDNYRGFSPAQLVFGRNPTSPSLVAAGPSGLEEVNVSAKVAQHLNAMHQARQAYIECESDRVVAEALKKRLYVGVEDVSKGMWVYYKQRGYFHGPVKIHSVDGKRLFAVRAGRLLTINKDDVVLAKPDEGTIVERDPLLTLSQEDERMKINSFEAEKRTAQEKEDSADGSSVENSTEEENLSLAPESNTEEIVPDNAVDDIELEDSSAERDQALDLENQEPGEVLQEEAAQVRVDCVVCGKTVYKKLLATHTKYVHGRAGESNEINDEVDNNAVRPVEALMKKKTKIFKEKQLVELNDGVNMKVVEIIKRGGKTTGKNANYWNVIDTRTGQKCGIDFKSYKVKLLGTVEDTLEEFVNLRKEDGSVVKVPIQTVYPYKTPGGMDDDTTTESSIEAREDTVERPEDATEAEEAPVQLLETNKSNESSEDTSSNVSKDSSLEGNCYTPDGSSAEGNCYTPEGSSLEGNCYTPKDSSLEESCYTPKDPTTDVIASDGVEEAYVATLPRSEHFTTEAMNAKEMELENLQKYDAYEVVDKPKDTKVLGTQWVLTRKEDVKDKTLIKTKARLCVRGDQEEGKDLIPTDSPTVSKLNLRLMLTMAAKNGWNVSSSDVTRAFLQSAEIQRNVFIRPPPEARVEKGKVWKLRKTVYGLLDASRGFFLNYGGNLIELGMETCQMDPAFFLYFKDNSKKGDEMRQLEGLSGLHVDDDFKTGSEEFAKNIEEPMKTKFTYGSHETLPLRYVGLNVSKVEDGLQLDQDHYVKILELPDIQKFSALRMDDQLTSDGQTEYRSLVSKITSLSCTSRPDLAFDAKVFCGKFGKATKRDLRDAIKKVSKVKSESTGMKFPDLGLLKDWMLVGYSDASLKSMPDRVVSVGGQVVFLVNKSTNRACILCWRSRQLRRVVHSSLGAESLSLLELLGDMFYIRKILCQMLGMRASKIPGIAVVDSKNLHESIHNIKPVDDRRLIDTIVEIKQAVALDKTVQEVRLVPGDKMIADGLTKKNGFCEELMRILQLGVHTIPGGWTINRKTSEFAKTWCDIGGGDSRMKQILWASQVLTPEEQETRDNNEERGETEDDDEGNK